MMLKYNKFPVGYTKVQVLFLKKKSYNRKYCSHNTYKQLSFVVMHKLRTQEIISKALPNKK